MTGLIKYEAACRAMAECKSVDEVKTWADKAAAMQAYGRMAKDKTLEVDAAEIRIRAERRLGEMLSAQRAGGGLNKGVRLRGSTDGKSSVVVADDRREKPTLSDAGISKDLSSRAQKLAAVPEKEFEAELAAKRERDQQEGARVSARLERAGEREMRKVQGDPAAESPPSPDQAQGEDADFDVLDELEQVHLENERLRKAIEVDDKAAEVLRWQNAYEVAQRRSDEHLQTIQSRDKQIKFLARQLERCGKAVGVADQDQIATAVERLMRTAKERANG